MALCPNVAPVSQWVSQWVSQSVSQWVTNLGIELLSQLKIKAYQYTQKYLKRKNIFKKVPVLSLHIAEATEPVLSLPLYEATELVLFFTYFSVSDLFEYIANRFCRFIYMKRQNRFWCWKNKICQYTQKCLKRKNM